jgi:aspartate racemase
LKAYPEKIEEFLLYLKNNKVKISVDGDNLNYNGPKESVTPELLSELKKRRVKIIEFLGKHKAKSLDDENIIYPREKKDYYPLSFGQHRLWFMSQVEPNSPLYNIYWAVKLEGKLNIKALGNSLNTIVKRHEVLRTIFKSIDGQPVQIIKENNKVEIPLIDLRKIPSQEQEKEVKTILNNESRTPFNLSSDLMLRATLIQLKEQEFVFLLVLHHIASDGWSMTMLFRELAILYSHFVSDRIPANLPELPIQYADYAIWQKTRWLKGKTMAKQLAYWNQILRNVPPILHLPTDKPRPEVQTFQGASYFFNISPTLSQSLKAICRQERVSPYMLLLAAFQTLLYRYTGDKDIIVGTPIANRNRSEIQNLIGFFVNTLVLRKRFDKNLTFQELLKQVRAITLGAFQNQDLPLEKIIEQLQPERYQNISPLFQVMFVLQNTPKDKLQLPNLSLTRLRIENPTAKFDLTLFMWEDQSGLTASFEYNTDLFVEATIARMANHFQNLLQAIATDIQQPVQKLKLLNEDERKQLLVEWNNNRSEYPRHSSLAELFEAQVQQNPHGIALVCEQEQLTYEQLNQKANQLAHYLQAQGIGREVPVGIYLERSLEVIISILGILKAGGAYVPLSPSYPLERLAFMINDTQVPIILSQERLKEKLSSVATKLVCLDSDAEIISQYPCDNPTTEVRADNLAYIMYTSGSTGQPKGVNVLQRGVIRLVKNCNYVDLSPEQVLLQLASISFDASTLEIWGALLNGGKLVLCPQEKPTLEEIGKIIEQEKISTMWLTSSLFNVMVDQRLEDLQGLKQLLIGGDVLSVTHVRRFKEKYPHISLINGYGPTENTTFSCCYEIKDTSNFFNSVPIGRAIANTQVYILDEEKQPVPIGVAGEIYVGGDGLARGYLNRKELNAEKFIDNPYGEGKVYKTGDLGRYLPDGKIEFLGRIDKQLKIRGFRIEPGEIEATINQYPSVRETIVLAQTDNLGNKQLVAYITYSQNREPLEEKVREFLQDRLPDYMIPDFLILLDGFPLTPNGKVDYSALPSPNQTAIESNFIPPRTKLELQVAKIWEQVLGIEPIGIRDNFFQLGGHSLLALTIFEKIEKICGATIPMATLFAAPTVEQLASVIRETGWTSSWLSLIPIQANGTKPPLFYVHGVLGTVMSSRHLANELDEDQPVYGIQAQGLQKKEIIHHRVEDMAVNYIKEIRTVQPKGPYNLVGVSTGGIIAFEMAQQLYSQGEMVSFLGMLDTQPPRSILQETLKLNQSKNRNLSFREIFKTELPDDEKMITFLEKNYEIVMQYLPQKYPGKITFFRAQESQQTFANKTISIWQSLASGGLEVHEVPGDHLSMIREENVPILGRKIQNCLKL